MPPTNIPPSPIPPGPGPFPPPKKKGGGCFLYGCLTVIILFTLFAVGTYFFLKSMLNRMVEQIGDTKPMVVESVELDPHEFEAVRARVQQFADGVRQGTGPAPLVLSARDLNALITGHPSFGDLKGKVFIDVQGEMVSAKISYPLEVFDLKGKYINGHIRGTFSFRNGIPSVNIVDAEFKGQKADPQLLAAINNDSRIADRIIRENAETSDFFNRLDSIEVKDGMITVAARK